MIIPIDDEASRSGKTIKVQPTDYQNGCLVGLSIIIEKEIHSDLEVATE